MRIYVQLHMVAVLAQRRALELLEMALLDPQRRGVRNGDAGVLRCVHTTGHLMPCLNEKGVSFLLRFAGLDVSFAFLIEIIGDPGRLGLPTRFPCASAYCCHPDHLAMDWFPLIPEDVAEISDSQCSQRENSHRLVSDIRNQD